VTGFGGGPGGEQTPSMRTFVVLLRGVNVGGHARVEMAGLREVCAGLGWESVRSYIQSGNIVARSEDSAEGMGIALRTAIRDRWEMDPAVFVREASTWSGYVDANPFPGAAAARPASVLLCVSDATPSEESIRSLEARGKEGERVEVAGGAIWIHYPAGAGRSRVDTATVERVLGARISMRNWATVLRLDAMALEATGSGNG